MASCHKPLMITLSQLLQFALTTRKATHFLHSISSKHGKDQSGINNGPKIWDSVDTAATTFYSVQKTLSSPPHLTRVRRHRRQITEVPNNRGTKQQGCQRAEGGKQ